MVYPEGNPPAPADWVERLEQSGLQCAISPLHDKDIDTTGEIKKAHYHVIACYSGPTTYNAVKVLTDSLNAPIPKPLDSIRGYYRYLTHKDNPDKYLYNEDDIKHLGGFNIADFVELTRSEVMEIKKRLMTLIRTQNMIEYADLMESLADADMWSEYEIASNHTIFFNAYLKSRRHRLGGVEQKSEIEVDKETGEVKESQ
jgi:hypothetical protein